jgi:hypothetical protein
MRRSEFVERSLTIEDVSGHDIVPSRLSGEA